jgi:hypothetical protein
VSGRGGEAVSEPVEHPFGVFVERHVGQVSTFDAHDVMVVTGYPLCRLEPGDALGVVLARQDARLIEHRQ